VDMQCLSSFIEVVQLLNKLHCPACIACRIPAVFFPPPYLTERPSVSLSVAPVRLGVVSLPGLPTSSGGLVELVTSAQTAGLLASSGETTLFTVLVHGVDDPVDPRISADSFVLGIDKNNLVILVCRILIDPVGVEDPQVGASATDPSFSGGLQGSLILELIDTLVGGLAVSSTLGSWPLAATPPDTDTVDNIALLGLVSQAASFIRTGGTGSTMDDVQLTELPAADAKQKAEDVGLLLLLKLLDVLESTHFED